VADFLQGTQAYSNVRHLSYYVCCCIWNPTC